MISIRLATVIALAIAATAGCVKPPEEEDPWAELEGYDDGIDDTLPYEEPTCTIAESDTFCPQYAQRFCEAHMGCCGDPENKHATMELCIRRTTCTCVGSRDGAAFGDGRVSIDDAAATTLLDRLADLASSCAPVAAEDLEVDRLYRGTLGEGADCSPVREDYSSLYACGPGLGCHILDLGEESVTGVCRRQLLEGEACEEGDCAPGLYCAENADLTTACRPHLAPGAACQFDFECGSDLCGEEDGLCAALTPDDGYCVDASYEP